MTKIRKQNLLRQYCILSSLLNLSCREKTTAKSALSILRTLVTLRQNSTRSASHSRETHVLTTADKMCPPSSSSSFLPTHFLFFQRRTSLIHPLVCHILPLKLLPRSCLGYSEMSVNTFMTSAHLYTSGLPYPPQSFPPQSFPV